MRGRGFEYRVMNKLKKKGWPYVNRQYASKGVMDIVAIKESVSLYSFERYCLVLFIQCKFDKVKKEYKEEKKTLIDFCKKCHTTPIWATSEKGKIKLINLLNGMPIGI